MALTRRRLLQVGIASAVLAGGRAAFAQQASRAKVPPVWLDMDQAELDAADQIRAQPAADHQALWNQQRRGTYAPRRAATPELRLEPHRGAGHLRDQQGERAD